MGEAANEGPRLGVDLGVFMQRLRSPTRGDGRRTAIVTGRGTSTKDATNRFRSNKMSTCWPYCRMWSAMRCGPGWSDVRRTGAGARCGGDTVRRAMTIHGAAARRMADRRAASLAAHGKRSRSEAELEGLRLRVNRGRPYGSDRWVKRRTKALGLASTFRPRGRPRKPRKDQK